MKIEHTTTPDGRPLTIALENGGSSRLPGHMSAEAVKRQLNIYRALDAQQKKAADAAAPIRP